MEGFMLGNWELPHELHPGLVGELTHCSGMAHSQISAAAAAVPLEPQLAAMPQQLCQGTSPLGDPRD